MQSMSALQCRRTQDGFAAGALIMPDPSASQKSWLLYFIVWVSSSNAPSGGGPVLDFQ